MERGADTAQGQKTPAAPPTHTHGREEDPVCGSTQGSSRCPAGHGGHGRDLGTMQVEEGTQNTKPLENAFNELHCS